jgi:hypothetical protein
MLAVFVGPSLAVGELIEPVSVYTPAAVKVTFALGVPLLVTEAEASGVVDDQFHAKNAVPSSSAVPVPVPAPVAVNTVPMLLSLAPIVVKFVVPLVTIW